MSSGKRPGLKRRKVGILSVVVQWTLYAYILSSDKEFICQRILILTPQTKVGNIFKYITALLLTTFTLPIIHLSYPPPPPPAPPPPKKKFAYDLLFSISPGYQWSQGKIKAMLFGGEGVNKVHYGQCDNGEFWCNLSRSSARRAVAYDDCRSVKLFLLTPAIFNYV